MAVCLVTGGAGFIGSHLVEALVARGDIARVLDNFSTGTLANLRRVQAHVEIISGDLSNLELVSGAARGVDCLYHFAAPASEIYDDHDRVTGRWANGTDTLHVLLAAREAGVRRVIYASSGSVYTHANALQLKESDPILPLSADGFGKLTGEHQCIAFASLYGLETVRLRYFNIFGPRQSPSSLHAAAIPVVLKAMLAGQSPVLLDNVHEFHDFLYVDDAVHAALLAADADHTSGKIYNIARGRLVNLLDVVATVNEILGTHIAPQWSKAHPDDTRPTAVSIAKAEAELGFCPGKDLKQGLMALIDYYESQSEPTGNDLTFEPVRDGPHFRQQSHSPPAAATGPSQPDA